jgi:addiction module HigA family antidote
LLPTIKAGLTNDTFNSYPSGLVLVDELEEREITQTALAEHIGVLNTTVNEICRGKRGISAEMAVKLSLALGASPQFWLNLQKNWELSQVDRKSVGRITPFAA